MKIAPLALGALLLHPTPCSAQEASSRPAPIWPEVTATNRPGVYWWIPGSAMDEENLTWNLEVLKDAGFGGMGMVLIYGVRGEEERFLDFLSPRWVEMFDHAAREAERLGLWLDLTPGGGWRLGGPEIEQERSELKISVEGDRLVPVAVESGVKRAGPGASGRAINPYSMKILREYLTKFDGVFAREGSIAPRAFYHDSFEYRGNWCAELLEVFEERRGYDLAAHAAALGGTGDEELVARVRHDYRQTLNELHLDCLRTLMDWAGEYGATVRQQAHGSPTNLLDAYAICGIPETEVFGAGTFAIPGLRREADNVARDRPSPLVNRLASSAAHVAGRPLVSSETCTWVRNHFRTALSQVKPEVDQLLLTGVNHILFHGCCYSPKDAEWPGWLFYASLQCNPRNALWRDIPALTAYVARCQSILQAGEPDNDILLYWPVHDLWNSSADPLNLNLGVHSPEFLLESNCGETAQRLVDGGYAFDFVSDELLLPVRTIRYGLHAQGASWRTVLVPETTYLPVETLAKLLVLARDGATVLFRGRLPEDVPGLFELEKRRGFFRELCESISLPEAVEGTPAVAEVGRGRVLVGDDLEALLAAAHVAPEPMAARGLGFIRRRHQGATHYFIANQGAEVVDEWIPLARRAACALVLDPLTGRQGLAPLREPGDSPMVRLQLRPGESLILQALETTSVEAPPWPIVTPAGEPIELRGEWQVEFQGGGPVLPAPFGTTELASWTEQDDEEAKRFAGTARYLLGFELPPEVLGAYRLELGDVRESARVSVNGEAVGTVIAHPFAIDLFDVLRPGRNLLEVEVTNLSANRIRALDRRGVEWKKFHDINFVDQNYRPFDASQWPLAPSGLLGPVRLVPLGPSSSPR